MKGCLVIAALAVALAGCADAVKPSAAQAPDTLEVRCDGTTTDVLTSPVQAQRDGVHVLVHNTSGDRLSVDWAGGGDGASPGESTLVFPINPGRSRIRCQQETEDASMENGDWGSFEVLAPAGWVSPHLDCPDSTYHGFADYAEGARGVTDPLADARGKFRQEGMVIEAGYSTAEDRTFINVTDEGPKESLTYMADGFGGWLQSESSGCSN